MWQEVSLIVILLLQLANADTSAYPLSRTYTNCRVISVQYELRLYWTIKQTGNARLSNPMVEMAIASNCAGGWHALGLSDDGSMCGGCGDCGTGPGRRFADGWIGGYNSGGTSYLGNAYMDDCSAPRLQGSGSMPTLPDWIPIAQARNGTYLASEFDRLITPLDPDTDYAIVNASVPIIWAVHNTRKLTDLRNIPRHLMQGSGGIGSTSFNLFEPSQCDLPEVPGSFQSGSGDFKASWALGTNNDIVFTIGARATGWIAFGIGDAPTMSNADDWVGWVSGASASLYDTWAANYNTPTSDTQQDLTLISGTEVNGWTELKFRRPLNTGEVGTDLVISDKQFYVMYAYHPTSDGTGPNTYPKHTATGIGTANFVGTAGAGNSTANFYTVPPGVASQPNQFNETWPDFKIQWAVAGGNITFYMEGVTTGWISIGFNAANKPTMLGADYITGWVDPAGSGAILLDTIANSATKGIPLDDTVGTNRKRAVGTNDVYLLDAGIVNGSTHMTFTRRLQTGDVNDWQIQDELISLHYAIGGAPGILPTVYLKHTVTGIVIVNLITGAHAAPNPPNTLVPAPPLPPTATNVSLGTGVHLTWEVRQPNIYFKLVSSTIGWVALGFGSTSLMANSDVNVGWVDTNGCYFYDQWAADSINIPIDDTALATPGTSYLTNGLVDCSEINGQTTMEWIRPLVGGVGDIDITNATQWVLYALAPQDGTSSAFYPKHTDVGALKLNLFSADPIPPPTPPPAAQPGSYSSPSGDFTVSWRLFTTPTLIDSIEFTMEAATTGWISFGVSNVPKMWPADITTGWVSGGTPYLYDAWSPDYNTPRSDTKQDITLISGTEVNGKTKFVFSRPLVTGDLTQDIDITSRKMYLEWAYFTADGVNQNDYTKHSAYGLASVFFLPSNGSNVTSTVTPYVVPPGIPLGIPQYTFTSPFNDFWLRWIVSGGNITMEARWKSVGWVSMGFCDNPLMYTADYYTGWIDPQGSGVLFFDSFSPDRNIPRPDSSQPSRPGNDDVYLMDAVLANGETTITFSRRLVTGDYCDSTGCNDVNITNRDLWLQWAYNPNPGLDQTFYPKHTVTGMRKINLLTGQEPQPAAFTPVVAQSLSSNAYTSNALGSDFTLHWDLLPLGCTDSACTQIHLQVVANSPGWISFGIGQGPSMTNADCYTGWVVDGTTNAYFLDTWSPDSVNQPKLDTAIGGTSGVTLTGASQVNGITTMSFIRNLAADDASTDIAIENKLQWILYATYSQDGTSPDFYSKHSSYRTAQLNFFQNPAVPPPPPPPAAANSWTSPDGTFTATWQLDDVLQEIEFTVEAQTTGWVSFGFSTDGPAMYPADFWTGWVTGGNAVVYDTWSPSYLIPTLDSSQDLTGISGSEVAGKTTLTFRRKYVTGDANDLAIEDRTVFVEFATHSSDGTSGTNYPKHTNYGIGQANFRGATTLQPNVKVQNISSLEFVAPPFDLLTSDEYFTLQTDDQAVELKWKNEVINDVEYTHFAVTVATIGWASIGISTTPKMTGDTYIFWVDSNSVGLLDQWMPDYQMPCSDESCPADRLGSTDSTGAAYSPVATFAQEVDGKTTVAFRRAHDTQDSLDHKIADENVYITWAYHKTKDGTEFAYSEHDEYSSATTAFYVNLITGEEAFNLRNFFTAGQWESVIVGFILLVYAIIRWTKKIVKRCRKVHGDKADIELLERGEKKKNRLSSLAHREADVEELPHNWTLCYTEEGVPYYWDTETNETTYQRPGVFKKNRRSSRMSAAQGGGGNMGLDLEDLDGVVAPTTKAIGGKLSNKVRGICSVRTYKEMSIKHWALVLAFLCVNGLAAWLASSRQTGANILGSLSAGTSFLLVLPATRNSILAFLLGIPFDKSIKFHRWMGRYCVVLGVSHLTWSFVNWSEDSSVDFGAEILRADGKMLSGVLSIFGLLFLFVTALNFFRRKHFNFFFISHHFFFVFFGFGSWHSVEFKWFTIIAACIYAFDKIFRNLQGTFPQKTTLIRIKLDYLVQFRFNRTFLQRVLHPAAVGQYLFLNVPSVSLTEWHPFSLSSGPLEVDMEVHVRALGDWTKRVFSKAARAEREGRQLTVRVDGPYGNLRFAYFRYPRIMMVVGGIGVTPAIGLLKDIYRTGEITETAKSFRRVVREIKLIWVIQSFGQLDWFKEELDEFLARAEGSDGPRLDIQCYVTRAKDDEENRFGGYTLKGRPDLDQIFGEHGQVSEDPAVIFTCGPSPMVNQTWSLTSGLKRQGHTYHFHSETFEF